ncbi:hypothetical protein AHF37_09186 [Paragonimus kellicotti]|nr:hypothetical protein AHF37_09186 [Paragonimus kellicotti]
MHWDFEEKQQKHKPRSTIIEAFVLAAVTYALSFLSLKSVLLPPGCLQRGWKVKKSEASNGYVEREEEADVPSDIDVDEEGQKEDDEENGDCEDDRDGYQI